MCPSLFPCFNTRKMYEISYKLLNFFHTLFPYVAIHDCVVIYDINYNLPAKISSLCLRLHNLLNTQRIDCPPKRQYVTHITQKSHRILLMDLTLLLNHSPVCILYWTQSLAENLEAHLIQLTQHTSSDTLKFQSPPCCSLSTNTNNQQHITNHNEAMVTQAEPLRLEEHKQAIYQIIQFILFYLELMSETDLSLLELIHLNTLITTLHKEVLYKELDTFTCYLERENNHVHKILKDLEMKALATLRSYAIQPL